MSDVLALYMSPRPGGNSDLLLDEFLRGVESAGASVDKVYARHLKMQGCIECAGCDEDGVCVLRDDMDLVYPLLIEAERVVVSTSIFFYGMPAQGKAVVDRTQALWNRVRLFPELKRPQGKGFLLALGATKGKNLFEGTILSMKYFMDAIGLPKDNIETLTYLRVEAKGAIKEHETAFKEAFEAGKKFAG